MFLSHARRKGKREQWDGEGKLIKKEVKKRRKLIKYWYQIL